MPANLTAKAIQSTAMKISKISISATAQKRVMIGLTVVGLLTMMAASFYMVLLLLTKPSAKLDATISIIALCATAAIFCFAIVVDFQLTRRRARSATDRGNMWVTLIASPVSGSAISMSSRCSCWRS